MDPTLKWYEQLPKIFNNSMGNPMWLPLMAVGVTLDTIEDRDKYALGIDQPSFYPATQNMLSYGITYPTVQLYYKFMVDAAVLIGANRSIAEKDMKEVIDFEILLAKASAKEVARNASLVSMKNIADFPPLPCGEEIHCPLSDNDEGNDRKDEIEKGDENSTTIHSTDGTLKNNVTITTPSWHVFFNKLYQAQGITNITINANESIILLNPQYFEKLLDLLNQTHPR